MGPSWPAGSWGWQLTLLDTNCKWRAAKPTTTARLRRDEMHGTTGLLSAARGALRWTELRRVRDSGIRPRRNPRSCASVRTRRHSRQSYSARFGRLAVASILLFRAGRAAAPHGYRDGPGGRR